MKTYNVIKTINGQEGNIIANYNNIEDARKELAYMLESAGNDSYRFFADKNSAEYEIEQAEEARESWGDSVVDTYIELLNDGIESGCPFIASKDEAECITMADDVFYYDNYKVEIEEVEE